MRRWSSSELRGLWKLLRDDHVLSVYIAAGEHDPAQRHAWRIRLDHALDAAQAGVAEEDRATFAQARAHIETALESHRGLLPGQGWAGFATAERLIFGDTVPASVPDRVVWRAGPSLAPLLRVTKQDRPVAVALVDAQRARLFRYLAAEIEEVADLRTLTGAGDLSDMGVSKRSANRSGIRGQTAHDAGQRWQEVESSRLFEQVAQQVAEIAETDGLTVLGGSKEAATGVARRLAPRFKDRMLVDSSLHLGLEAADVRAAAERNASLISRQLQDQVVSDALEQAGSGRTRQGHLAADHALELGQAERVLLSASFLEREPDMADRLVGLAMDTGADADLVAGDGAAQLDEVAGGVVVRLRYEPYPAVSPPVAEDSG